MFIVAMYSTLRGRVSSLLIHHGSLEDHECPFWTRPDTAIQHVATRTTTLSIAALG